MVHYLCLNSWVGRQEIPVEILDETPSRYRIRLLHDCKLPGRNRYGSMGDIVLVPKYAIREENKNAR